MQRIMSVFDDADTAMSAVQRLTEAGWHGDSVRVLRGDQADLFADAAAAGGAIQAQPDEGDRGVLSSIGHFVTSLFGVDSPESHARSYTEAVRRGCSLVMVDASDDGQRERAHSILREMGAIDIDQRSEQSRAAGSAASQPDKTAAQRPGRPRV